MLKSPTVWHIVWLIHHHSLWYIQIFFKQFIEGKLLRNLKMCVYIYIYIYTHTIMIRI